jgi:hypothetical protein
LGEFFNEKIELPILKNENRVNMQYSAFFNNLYSKKSIDLMDDIKNENSRVHIYLGRKNIILLIISIRSWKNIYSNFSRM